MSKKKERDFYVEFKLLILGNAAVGKTYLLQRYCDEQLSKISTIGIDVKIKHIELNRKKLQLKIWDTAGQETFKAITCNYLKGTHGAIIVYSVECKQSFNKVKDWIKCIKESCNVNVSILLIGSKSDSADRVITYEQGQNLAEKYNIPFYETSALNNINVSESFNQLAKMCLDQHEIAQQEINNQNSINGLNQPQRLTSKKKEEDIKNSCC
ncbi:hypothetical protein ABPG74_006590 [Tetrahymena malaccensis]